jgi:hypothetical protein
MNHSRSGGSGARACGLAVGAALGVHHLVQRALGARLKPLGQLVEHIAELVTPAGLLAGLGPDLARRAAIVVAQHRRAVTVD